jgi:hypothetical protein
MKEIIYVYIVAGLFLSCTKGFTTLNTDPNKFTVVTPEASIESAVRSLNTQMANYNFQHYWDLTNEVIAGTRYDVTDGGLWQTAYVNVLENLDQVITNYGNDSAYNNRVQIARIMKCYTYSILVGQFGPVPLSQANNLNNLSTILFDSEDSVYSYILNNLKDATSKIKLTGDKLSYDVVYSGNLQYWVDFANTFRLKIALRCMRNMGTLATSTIQDVMANETNTITSEAATAKMAYENVTGNQNPYWIKYVQSGGYYPYTSTATGVAPKLGDFLLTFFRSYNDPRLSTYFDSVPVASRFAITDTLASTADDSMRVVTYPVPYLGMPLATTLLPGWTSLVGVASPLGGTNNNSFSNIASAIVTNPARPFIMLSYAETLFLKAEAAALGYGGSMSAQQYYYAGIAANFAYWGLSNSALTAYENTSGIKWGTAGTGFNEYLGIVNANIPLADINKIWIQSWLNYFPDQAFDFWCMERRTRALNFAPNTNPGGNSSYSSTPLYSDIPGRGSYPNAEITLNTNGYNSALPELGVASQNQEWNPTIELQFALPYTIPDWNNMSPTYDARYLEKWYGTTIQSLKSAAASAGFTYTIKSTYLP